jgi:hypothetical protein
VMEKDLDAAGMAKSQQELSSINERLEKGKIIDVGELFKEFQMVIDLRLVVLLGS